LVVWVVVLERRIHRLLSGKNGSSLEDTITKNTLSIQALFQFRDEVHAELAKIDARDEKEDSRAKTKRFNPFAGNRDRRQSKFRDRPS